MALVKIRDFDPRYPGNVGDKDLIHSSVYADRNHEKIGTVEDILLDEATGEFRYFVVDIGFWIFGKTVLLPVEYCQINFPERRIEVQEMTKEQAEHLPRYDGLHLVDQEHEDQISAIYPPRSMNSLNTMDPLGNPVSPASPISPYLPMTIGSLATLTAPMSSPYGGPPPAIEPDRDRNF